GNPAMSRRTLISLVPIVHERASRRVKAGLAVLAGAGALVGAGSAPALAGGAAAEAAAALIRSGTRDGVAAVTARDAWAVGYTTSGHTLIMRWDGKAWSRVPSPNPVTGGLLQGVAATSGRDAWAVGGTASSQMGGISYTFILHWN